MRNKFVLFKNEKKKMCLFKTWNFVGAHMFVYTFWFHLSILDKGLLGMPFVVGFFRFLTFLLRQIFYFSIEMSGLCCVMQS